MKHVDFNVNDTWCYSGLKNDFHVLFERDFARTVWLNTGFQPLIHILPNDTSFEILMRIFFRCTREHCADGNDMLECMEP